MRRISFHLCGKASTSFPENLRVLNSSNDTIDSIYPYLRAGKHVLVKDSLELAAKFQHYLVELCQMEYPAVDVPSLVHQQAVIHSMNKCLLIDRDFEVFPDFIDAVNNTSFSAHLQYFEETHWNKSIGREMLQYAEKVYPKISHAYLSVSSYLTLVDSFAASRNGVSYPRLLGKTRLRPLFGVHVPKAIHLQHIQLFLTWFRTMQKPLMLNRVLCLNTGLGVLPLSLSQNKLQGVLCTDPNPRAIEGMLGDVQSFRDGKFKDKLVCQNAALFPKIDTSKILFDCVVYSPDLLRFSTYEVHETPYAPGLSGIDGEFESFFENAASCMRDWGVAVVVTTNFRTLIEPGKPHPVEYEVKHNRRWVVLDYYESPMRGLADKHDENEFVPDFVQRVKSSLRAEIWILHTISSIGQFGFVHGIPNANPPDAVRDIWGTKKLKNYQRTVIRECAQSLGATVKNIKARLASVLSDADNQMENDDEGEYIHMKLDPANFLKKIQCKQEEFLRVREAKRQSYETDIQENFPSFRSPRDAFDEKWDSVHRSVGSSVPDVQESTRNEDYEPMTGIFNPSQSL